MLSVINKNGNSVLFGFILSSKHNNKLILPSQFSWLLLGILLHTKEVTLTISCFIRLTHQVPVVRKVDNAIHRINHYPVDSVVCFVNTYPLDSDLSGG